MIDKEILSAALWFTVCAAVMTAVGNFVCPQAGNIAASYYTLKSEGKPANAEAVKAGSSKKTEAAAVSEKPSDSPVKREREISSSEVKAPVKEKQFSAAVHEQPAEKTPEVAASEAASPVSEKADARSQTGLPEKKAEHPTDEPESLVREKSEKDAQSAAKEAEPPLAAKKTLTEAEISEAAKSLAQGEILELGAGRVAYKIKKGDTLSQICKKVFGTSLGWKEKAKKLNTDYRKIRPGDVLIFEKNM